MRKNPIVILVTVLALAASLYVSSRIVMAEDGPCTPREPAPKGAG